MFRIRKAEERGHFDHGWLDTYHTFSFADYYDPEHMGFRSLRVINDDRVAPGHGFPMHAHRDMEIVTYVLDGALAHRDSMGTGSTIRPGEVQRMSAGTGVRHSEVNPLDDTELHLLQIWLLPERTGITPGYEQKACSELHGRMRLVASPDAAAGSLTIHSDARVYAGVLAAGQTAEVGLAPGRHGWIQVARGRARVNGQDLAAGDGASVSDETALRLEGVDDAELLAFDLG